MLQIIPMVNKTDDKDVITVFEVQDCMCGDADVLVVRHYYHAINKDNELIVLDDGKIRDYKLLVPPKDETEKKDTGQPVR